MLKNNNKSKITKFLLTFFSTTLLLLTWFVLSLFFHNIVSIKDVLINTFKLLKDNFQWDIWSSEFYYKIVKTIFSAITSFTICMLLGILLAPLNKNHYFKSFFKPVKIIMSILPISFIAYFICFLKFNLEFKLDEVVFPIIVAILFSCGTFINFFENYFYRQDEAESIESYKLIEFIRSKINLSFQMVITSEIVLNSFKKISNNNFGGLIIYEFDNQNITNVLSLILILLLIIFIINLVITLFECIIKLFANFIKLFKKDEKN